MVKVIKSLLIVGGVVGLYYVISGLYELKSICYKYLGFKVSNIDLFNNTASIQVMVGLSNPSHFGAKIDGYNFDVYINNVHIANLVNNSVKLDIYAHGNGIIILPITIDYSKLGTLVLPILTALINKNWSGLTLHVTGSLIGEIAGIKFNKGIILEKSISDIKSSFNQPDTNCQTKLKTEFQGIVNKVRTKL